MADQIVWVSYIVLALCCMAFLGRHAEPSETVTPEEAAAKTRRRERLWWCALGGIGIAVLNLAWSSAAAAKTYAWQTFHSDGGGYSVDLPGEVSEEILEPGNGVTVHRVRVVDQKHDITYDVSYRDPIPGLRMSSSNFVRSMEQRFGAPIRKREFSVKGVHGCEVMIHPSDRTTATCWGFPDRQRFCWLTVVSRNEFVGCADVERFLNSFRFGG